MDLLVAPSVAPETFCRVIAEAQASGLAVIGSRIGGIPEAFVPNESGLLVEPHDGRELRSAIRRLYDDRVLCARFAAIGKRYAHRNFAALHIAEQFVAALGSQRSVFYPSPIAATSPAILPAGSPSPRREWTKPSAVSRRRPIRNASSASESLP
jgi:hypothetical protein